MDVWKCRRKICNMSDRASSNIKDIARDRVSIGLAKPALGGLVVE